LTSRTALARPSAPSQADICPDPRSRPPTLTRKGVEVSGRKFCSANAPPVQVCLYGHTHHKRQGLHDQAPRPYTRDTHTRQATGAEHGQAPRPYRRRAEGECRQGEQSSGASKRASKRAALCTKVDEEMGAPCPGRARQPPSPWGDHDVRASRAIAPLVDHHPMGLGRPYVDGLALASAAMPSTPAAAAVPVRARGSGSGSG